MKDIGLIGLGVMGRSLALNMANNNYNVSVYNHRDIRTKDFMNTDANGKNIYDFYDVESFTKSLIKPRKIVLMTMSGEPVDSMIQNLIPFMEKGDIIIDGGNTYFPDTIRRLEYLKEKEILYLGVGVSGGEAGALNGPSIMPGGTMEAYNLVKDILIKIAADGDYGPCCKYMGNHGAGHFVKMVHNGIEYAIMQAISEVYHLLGTVLHLSNEEIADIFEKWNGGKLNSYLMEITHKVLRMKDEHTNVSMVDVILDKAGQKGTGKWTAETAFELGIPTPSLNVAVISRTISFFKEERTEISKKIKKEYPQNNINKEQFIEDIENSLIFTNILIFSQGLWLISEASKSYNFNINTIDVLKVWSGGCIIRAELLDYYINILEKDNTNINLLNCESTLNYLNRNLNSVQNLLRISMDNFIPCFVINSSLDYFYSMIEEQLPANLIQAQRDFFGAHTYNRIDKEGIFHTIWEE